MPGISFKNPLIPKVPQNTNTGRVTTPAGVRQFENTLNNAVSNGTNTQPPAKADAANKKNSYVGLCEALNKMELELVSSGKFEVANEYAIEFAPPLLASSKVVKRGTTNKSATPGQQGQSAADQADPERQSMSKDARVWQVQAGQPIVQFIDEVMRNSSFILDQAKYQTDEVTKELLPQPSLGQVSWYKINVQCTPKLPYDKKRQDYAYLVKFVITPYAINNMLSEYFPDSNFRGVHKSYNYWFTGQNTQVLNFEQDFNSLYYQTVTNAQVPVSPQITSNNVLLTSRMYQAASQQNSQGAENAANEISANAADRLYSPSDQGSVKLKIIGDPAWLQQGEAAVGVDEKNFSFAPFNDDGTINFDSQQILFDVSFNQPTDYNFDTGIMDVGASNLNRTASSAGNARENYTYVATECRSYFRGGRFEQELTGTLFPLVTGAMKSSDAGRPPSPTTEPANKTTDTTREWSMAGALGITKAPPTLASDQIKNSLNSLENYNQISNKNPSTANTPTPPTSNGGLTFSQDIANRRAGIITKPQTMAPKDE